VAIVAIAATGGLRVSLHGEPGIELVSRQAAMRGALRRRVPRQQLAAEEADSEEDEDPVIRFENDNKVGGGDLQVPVSMVDYENLGEGSIVDQRYPRKLPGADELEAEWNSLFSWGSEDGEEGEDSGNAWFDWSSPDRGADADADADDDNAGKLASMGVNVHGHGVKSSRAKR